MDIVGQTISLKAVQANSTGEDVAGFNFTGVAHNTTSFFQLQRTAVSSSSSTLIVLFTQYDDDRLFPQNSSRNAGTVGTQVVDVTIIGGQLSGLLLFNFKMPQLDGTLRCVYWTAQNTWATNGVTTAKGPSAVQCASEHLTNFAVLVV